MLLPLFFFVLLHLVLLIELFLPNQGPSVAVMCTPYLGYQQALLPHISKIINCAKSCPKQAITMHLYYNLYGVTNYIQSCPKLQFACMFDYINQVIIDLAKSCFLHGAPSIKYKHDACEIICFKFWLV